MPKIPDGLLGQMSEAGLDLQKIGQLRQDYVSFYPDKEKLIGALAEMIELLVEQKERNNLVELKRRGNHTDPLPLPLSLAGHQGRLTEFFINNPDEEVAADLWGALDKVSERHGPDAVRIGTAIRRGILTQVAMYNIFEKLGLNPKLTTPERDTLDQADFELGDTHHIVQVKSDQGIKQPITVRITKTQELAHPHITIAQGLHFSSLKDAGLTRLIESVNSYQQRHGGEAVTAYYIDLPYSQLNHNNGLPEVGLIKSMAEQLTKVCGEEPALFEKLKQVA